MRRLLLGLTSDEKAFTQQELGELEAEHDRLKQQTQEAVDAGQDKFESIRQDLSKTLEGVGKNIEETTIKLEQEMEK